MLSPGIRDVQKVDWW